MRHKIISIEGNIGAGKTTLATLIAKATGRRLVLEQFEQNPFLANFYAEPDKYAFHTELFFLAERYEQWRQMADEPVVADYSLAKSLYFAEVTLKGAELQVFNRIYEGLMETATKPNLTIYLDRSTQQLNAQILLRGREYEQAIPNSYLQQIQDNYLRHLSLLSDQPIVVVDGRERDFREGSADLDWILGLIDKPYPVGITKL
jgi:deoxyadenosine/deoxycytidine kinase